MNTPLSLSPLFRQSVGFDRFNDLFEAALKNEQTGNAYPPYNIVKKDEDTYGITMAVAGFNEENLNIIVQNGQLTVSGRMEDALEGEEGSEYLHRGIASRAFERTFRLADHMEVTGAELRNGLLHIALIREIPDAAKPRTISISSGNGSSLLDAVSGKAKKKAA